MSMNSTGWPIDSRNIRAVISAFILMIFAGWIIYDDYTKPELISSYEGVGEVVYSSSGNCDVSAKNVLLKIKAEGEVFNVIVSKIPYPKMGDVVPVHVEKYSDNTKFITLDKQKLRLETLGY